LTFNYSIDNSKDAIREFKVTQNDKIISKIKEVKIDEKDSKKLNLVLEKQLAK
jgi:hypothetical protein